MSGVTADDNTDLQTIMTGGGNFVARVTAFYKAKEEADAAIKKQGDIANFTTRQAEVEAAHAKIADETKAAEELSQRIRGEAGQLASQMTADAGTLVDKAKANVKELLIEANKQAEEIRGKAYEERAKVQESSRSIESRAAEVAGQAKALSDKQKELDAAIATANQSKDRYDAKLATLTAALAAQG